MPTQAQTVIPDHLYTVREASELGFGGQRTIRRWIANGKLPAVRFGAALRIKGSDLLAYRDGHTHTATSTPSDELDQHISALVDSAPSLSTEQIDRLAGLLGGVSK